jgi:hypothetical protein
VQRAAAARCGAWHVVPDVKGPADHHEQDHLSRYSARAFDLPGELRDQEQEGQAYEASSDQDLRIVH